MARRKKAITETDVRSDLTPEAEAPPVPPDPVEETSPHGPAAAGEEVVPPIQPPPPPPSSPKQGKSADPVRELLKKLRQHRKDLKGTKMRPTASVEAQFNRLKAQNNLEKVNSLIGLYEDAMKVERLVDSGATFRQAKKSVQGK